MPSAIEPTLDAIFIGLFASSIACGFGCAFCALYGGARLSFEQKRLLQTLQELAPLVYRRLHDPLWRGHITPWNLSVFLKSEELDDVPDIHEAKEGCRHAWRWQIRGMLGFMIAWGFGFAVGVLAVALGSTSIRFSG